MRSSCTTGRYSGLAVSLGIISITVDVDSAAYTNNIGAVALHAWWRDPDFNTDERAFYYVRVLEIPTPTWLAYDRAFFGIDLPENTTLVHQERAYTSPVWYTP